MEKKKMIYADDLKECFRAGVINSFDTFPVDYICDAIDESPEIDAVVLPLERIDGMPDAVSQMTPEEAFETGYMFGQKKAETENGDV